MLKHLLALLLFPLCVNAAEPSLFERMRGCWKGEGKIYALAAEKEYLLTSLTFSQVADGRLNSHNRVRNETLNRSYVRDYWIQPQDEFGERFLLGDASGQRSYGRFDSEAIRFISEQVIDPLRRVFSETQFFKDQPNRVEYRESFYYDNVEMRLTQIVYTRVDSKHCTQ